MTTTDSVFVIYYLTPYEDLAANTDYYFSVTTQNGNAA